ncbi:MAG TPA: hypothetical protein VF765_31200 [Polyangiaceae bacterium]
MNRDTKPENIIQRTNPCGGSWWNGYARVYCHLQAPDGRARCDACQEAEDRRKQARAAELAAAAPARRRPARRA